MRPAPRLQVENPANPNFSPSSSSTRMTPSGIYSPTSGTAMTIQTDKEAERYNPSDVDLDTAYQRLKEEHQEQAVKLRETVQQCSTLQNQLDAMRILFSMMQQGLQQQKTALDQAKEKEETVAAALAQANKEKKEAVAACRVLQQETQTLDLLTEIFATLRVSNYNTSGGSINNKALMLDVLTDALAPRTSNPSVPVGNGYNAFCLPQNSPVGREAQSGNVSVLSTPVTPFNYSVNPNITPSFFSQTSTQTGNVSFTAPSTVSFNPSPNPSIPAIIITPSYASTQTSTQISTQRQIGNSHHTNFSPMKRY